MVAANPHAVRGRDRKPGVIDPKALGGFTLSSKSLHLDNGLYWTDVSKTTRPTNNDPVYWWDDISTYARHVSQSTLAKRPLYKANVSGSYGGLKFDGTDDDLTVGTAVCSGTTGTVFLVVYLSSNLQHGVFFGVGTSNNGWKVGVGGTNLETNGNQLCILSDMIAWHNNLGAIGVGVHLITLRLTSSVFEFWIDGVSAGSFTGSQNTPSQITHIGAGELANRWYTDHLLEIMVSSASVNNTEIAAGNIMLKEKYGIP